MDHVSSRTANPSSSLIRNIVAKDGFSKTVRMECHEDADTSTASLVSEANQDQTNSVAEEMNQDSISSKSSEDEPQVKTCFDLLLL